MAMRGRGISRVYGYRPEVRGDGSGPLTMTQVLYSSPLSCSTHTHTRRSIRERRSTKPPTTCTRSRGPHVVTTPWTPCSWSVLLHSRGKWERGIRAVSPSSETKGPLAPRKLQVRPLDLVALQGTPCFRQPGARTGGTLWRQSDVRV